MFELQPYVLVASFICFAASCGFGVGATVSAMPPAHLLVEPWGPNTLRVRATAHGVAFNTAVPSGLKDGDTPPAATTADLSGNVTIQSGNIYAEIDNATSLIKFYRASDHVMLLEELHRVVPAPSAVSAGNAAPASVSFSAQPTDAIYGLGQGVPFTPFPVFRPDTLNHKGDNISFADCVANEGGAANCLPWHISVASSDQGGASTEREVMFGFFWNVPAVDGGLSFGNTSTKYWAQAAYQIDYLIMAPNGNETKQDGTKRLSTLISQYTNLIGRTFPLPSSLLGYWHSKNCYRTQEEVMEAHEGFVQRDIPVDVFIIDIGGSQGVYQGDWGFNPNQFPDPSNMTAELAKTNTRVMVSVWAGTGKGSASWQTMLDNNWVVLNHTVSPPEPMPWPGLCRYYPDSNVTSAPYNGNDCWLYDASNPKARAYVWDRLTAGYVRHNVTLFWLDASEPQPPTLGWGGTPLFSDGSYQQGPVAEAGLAFGKWHTATFFEGFQRSGLNESVVLARSGWYGSASHGAGLWSGDTQSDWTTLKTSIATGLGAQLAGIAWWTSDIGGYTAFKDKRICKYMPETELVVRWFQFGMTCPLMRQHGCRPETVPWAYGKVAEKVIVKMIRQRAAMKQYLREQHDLLASTGRPFNVPLWYDFPDDPTVWTLPDVDEYMMGSDYLAAPVTIRGARSRSVYLPTSGTGNRTTIWTHYYSEANYTGGQFYNVSAPLDEFPLFFRAAN